MPSTPVSGQISFDQIKSLSTDKIGYTPPANVSLGTLASIVRQFGQRAPGYDNIAFSNFYISTIAGYGIVTTTESYGGQYYANKNDGTITVWFRWNTFKRQSGGNNIYVRVNVLRGNTVVSSQAKSINWYNPNNQNFIQFTSLNSEIYNVSIEDLITGAIINTQQVSITYNGANNSYFYNL
jgi:hypothetical protein